MNALFNGKPADGLSGSRALHFGDGVFRTLLVWDGRLLDWDLHMQKLAFDCAALQLKMPDVALLYAEAKQIILQQQRATFKIIIFRQTEGRGYGSETEKSDRILLTQPAPNYPLAKWTDGVRVFRSPFLLADQPAFAGIKHLNRLEQVMASRRWPIGMDEGILSNQAGHPICGIRTNLFWIRHGELFTPQLAACGVSGMMRHKIMQWSREHTIKVCDCITTWDNLVQADELFLSNSIIGIWPVKQLEDRLWKAPGPITSMLQSALNHPRVVE